MGGRQTWMGMQTIWMLSPISPSNYRAIAEKEFGSLLPRDNKQRIPFRVIKWETGRLGLSVMEHSMDRKSKCRWTPSTGYCWRLVLIGIIGIKLKAGATPLELCTCIMWPISTKSLCHLLVRMRSAQVASPRVVSFVTSVSSREIS